MRKKKGKVREWKAWISMSRHSYADASDMSIFTTKQQAVRFQRQVGVNRDEVIPVTITERKAR